MEASATAAPPAAPLGNRTVETIRGQHHKFMLIPMIEHHATWFEAGPVSIAVEARALGDSPQRMVRGPSIHVFSAARDEEYIRFDALASEVEEQGWDTSVLDAVASAATAALAPREDDMVRAKEGMDWMYEWKRRHPQFNTLEEGEY